MADTGWLHAAPGRTLTSIIGNGGFLVNAGQEGEDIRAAYCGGLTAGRASAILNLRFQR